MSWVYPLLCWWHHLAFFNVVQQTPNPTRMKWFKARCYGRPNFWSFTSFWLGQSKHSSVQCLKKFLQLWTLYNLPDNYPLPMAWTLSKGGAGRVVRERQWWARLESQRNSGLSQANVEWLKKPTCYYLTLSSSASASGVTGVSWKNNAWTTDGRGSTTIITANKKNSSGHQSRAEDYRYMSTGDICRHKKKYIKTSF